jgi:large subunit ribosomal protein L21
LSGSVGKEAVTVYAIVKAGGKQHRVQVGDTIYVERLEAPVGEKLELGQVLLVSGDSGTRVGAPVVENAAVLGTVLEQARDHKVKVFKYKKPKHYRRTRGHRQAYTSVRIDAIQA